MKKAWIASLSSLDNKDSKFPKSSLFLVTLVIILLSLINSVYAEVRINEIELNPAGTDAGNEWIELYSDSLINLDGWKLVNHDNKVLLLNQSFNGYFVVNFGEQWLDNKNESVILYNGGSLVSITPVLRDSSNDNKTWNYCNGIWLLLSSSHGYVNNCQVQSNNTNSNSTNNTNNHTNQTNPPANNTSNNSPNSEISLILDWDEDDIVNGKTFEITIKANNLQNKKYDIKAGIYDADNKLISQTYDENEKWVSSSEYYNKFFSGPGSAEKGIKLRIKETYRDYKGDGKIIVRIRETGSSTYKKEKQEYIEVLKARLTSGTNTNTNIDSEENAITKEVIKSTTNNPSDSETKNVIQLGKTLKTTGTESIKTSKNTIYQSKNELIKTYSIYFFAFLLIILCILLIFLRI